MLQAGISIIIITIDVIIDIIFVIAHVIDIFSNNLSQPQANVLIVWTAFVLGEQKQQFQFRVKSMAASSSIVFRGEERERVGLERRKQ